MPRVGYAEVVGAAVGSASNAGWFGDGRDGDLIVEAGQTYVFDVALDEGQVVKQFRNVYIGEGATVKTSGRCNGMVWSVQGNFENHGTITMDKCAPLLNSMEEECASEPHIKLCGLVGGNGGKAGLGHFVQSAHKSPGIPGNGFPFGGGYGSGSGSRGYAGGDAEPRPPVGTVIPYPGSTGEGKYGSGAGYDGYAGGAGPGGSGAVGTYYGGHSPHSNGNAGEAIGGGAFFLFVGGRVVNKGVITACGGNGATGVKVVATNQNGGYHTGAPDASGSGGAAGGGIIAIVHTGDYQNSGSIIANGGKGGPRIEQSSQDDKTAVGEAGADGEAGPVLITTLDELLASA